MCYFVLGDCEYKPYVTSSADIEEVVLDETADFVVIGCDGLFDVMLGCDVVDVCYTYLNDNKGKFKFTMSVKQ